MDAFNADVALLPMWVQHWMNFLGLVTIVSVVILLFKKETRVIAVLTLLAMVAGAAVMVWIHSRMGMVKLLGIAHVVFWTPLLVLIWKKLRSVDLPILFKTVLWILMLTYIAALAFDYVDVIRWILGNRAPVVAAS